MVEETQPSSRTRGASQGRASDRKGNDLDAVRRTTAFRYSDLHAAVDVAAQMRKLEKLLQPEIPTAARRSEALLKIILVKLQDERESFSDNKRRMLFQDFSDSDQQGLEALFTNALEKALENPGVSFGSELLVPEFGLSNKLLSSISLQLCETRLLGGIDAIHELCAYFGEKYFKALSGESFVPWEVSQLIAELIGPRPGEHIVDPACGSGDLLAAALRVAFQRYPLKFANCIRGYDNDPHALRWSAFSIFANGGSEFTQLELKDTLLEPPERAGPFDIALCDPPFDAKSIER